MLVREVMSTPVYTCDLEETLAVAAERMLEHGIGSVLVTDESPTGILTDSDIIEASYRTGEPLSAIDVADAMSEPLVTIAPDRTLRKVTETMQTHDIKKLPVIDDLDVVGMVTLTDIMYQFGDLKREIFDLYRRERSMDDQFDRFASDHS